MDVIVFLATFLRVILSLPMLVFLAGTVSPAINNIYFKPRYNFQFVTDVSSFVSWLVKSFISAAIAALTVLFFLYLCLLVWPFGEISFAVLFVLINRKLNQLKASSNNWNITFFQRFD